MSWKGQVRRLMDRILKSAGFTLRFVFGYAPANMIFVELC